MHVMYVTHFTIGLGNKNTFEQNFESFCVYAAINIELSRSLYF